MICKGGECVEQSECTEGEINCSDDGLSHRICKEGNWIEEKCPEGVKCESGLCIETPLEEPCNNGEQKCSGDNKILLTCEENSWKETTTCSDGCILIDDNKAICDECGADKIWCHTHDEGIDELCKCVGGQKTCTLCPETTPKCIAPAQNSAECVKECNDGDITCKNEEHTFSLPTIQKSYIQGVLYQCKDSEWNTQQPIYCINNPAHQQHSINEIFDMPCPTKQECLCDGIICKNNHKITCYECNNGKFCNNQKALPVLISNIIQTFNYTNIIDNIINCDQLPDGFLSTSEACSDASTQ
jgi:hypothetical protein